MDSFCRPQSQQSCSDSSCSNRPTGIKILWPSLNTISISKQNFPFNGTSTIRPIRLGLFSSGIYFSFGNWPSVIAGEIILSKQPFYKSIYKVFKNMTRSNKSWRSNFLRPFRSNKIFLVWPPLLNPLREVSNRYFLGKGLHNGPKPEFLVLG